MTPKLPMLLAVSALLAVPLAAQAVTYQFNASLNGAQQAPTPVVTAATGVATLFYDNMNTASTADDLYSFSMSALGLSGVATVYHIHAAAPAGLNAGVKVFLDTAPFVSLNFGGTVLVGGSNVATPYANFLADLQAGLAYVNIHTATNPRGEIRGQLMQVAVVPEPSTYALLLAGIGMIGMLARRRRG